jgi:hypothetical protein
MAAKVAASALAWWRTEAGWEGLVLLRGLAAINVAQAAGLAVTARGAQVRPGKLLAQRGGEGTHPTSPREAA